MNESKKPTVLITGASSGIGKEFAILFAKKHYNLVLIALEQDLLDTLAEKLQHKYGINTLALAIDLAEDDAAQTIYDRIDQAGIEIDILINNAGYGIKGFFCQTDIGQVHTMMAVNMTTLTKLIKLFAPKMLARGYGRILNTASTAAFQPGPGMAVYFATKAYILSLSQALTEEFRDTGVTVTALCPGPTLSHFAENANLKGNPIHSGIVPMWTSKEVARYGYKVLMQGRRVATVGVINAICGFMSRISPTAVVMRYIRKLHGI